MHQGSHVGLELPLWEFWRWTHFSNRYRTIQILYPILLNYSFLRNLSISYKLSNMWQQKSLSILWMSLRSVAIASLLFLVLTTNISFFFFSFFYFLLFSNLRIHQYCLTSRTSVLLILFSLVMCFLFCWFLFF